MRNTSHRPSRSARSLARGAPIRALQSGDVARAADVLADAFQTDPFSMWLFPTKDLRNRLVASWTVQLRSVYLPIGHAYATEDLDGVALWSPPPGKVRSSVLQQARLFAAYVRILGPRRLPAAASGFAVIDDAHPDEPHWYLSALGVDPVRQRSGLGSSLLEDGLERADREGVIAYLETFNPDNVAYYERFGFRVTKEDDIPRGPHMWAMTRNAI